jgi:hypothetical protein
MSENTIEIENTQEEMTERELLIILTQSIMAISKQQEMILDLLVPDLKEDKKEEPSLKELMVIQIDQIENLTKKLIPENS